MRSCGARGAHIELVRAARVQRAGMSGHSVHDVSAHAHIDPRKCRRRGSIDACHLRIRPRKRCQPAEQLWASRTRSWSSGARQGFEEGHCLRAAQPRRCQFRELARKRNGRLGVERVLVHDGLGREPAVIVFLELPAPASFPRRHPVMLRKSSPLSRHAAGGWARGRLAGQQGRPSPSHTAGRGC